MIKLEMKVGDSTLISDTTTVSFATEASGEKDLPILDVLAECLGGPYPCRSGFNNSNRLVFTFYDLPKTLVESLLRTESIQPSTISS